MTGVAGVTVRAPNRWALRFIETYQQRTAERIGARCPMVPSCSAYGAEAFRHHGFVRAGAMTVRRLARCR